MIEYHNSDKRDGMLPIKIIAVRMVGDGAAAATTARRAAKAAQAAPDAAPDISPTGLGFNTLPRMSPAAEPAQKSDATRVAALLPHVAEMVISRRITLGAAELLSAVIQRFYRRHEAITGNILADLVPVPPDELSARRDELLRAGLLDTVRTDTLGTIGYRPAPALWAERLPAQKSDGGHPAASFDAQRGTAPQPARPHVTDARLFASMLGARRT